MGLTLRFKPLTDLGALYATDFPSAGINSARAPGLYRSDESLQARSVVQPDPRPTDNEYVSAGLMLLATFVGLFVVAAIAHPELVGLGG